MKRIKFVFTSQKPTNRHIRAIKISVLAILLSALATTNVFAQKFESMEKAKAYFYNLDDRFNAAMSKKDSMFFINHFSDEFINTTPYGALNNKWEETSALIELAPLHVERAAPQFDIFTYSCDVATLSITKKLLMKDSTILYVRRTIVHKIIDGKWKIVSGQGTTVPPKVVEGK
ncbi:MAG: hypothetical protein LBE82_08170 [Chitinophagaceae bacterium]|jgi:hypothetical protein|nr:hypothetical protein [Chitinophagaceae bacterium]